jgi:hypothetical protein
MVVTDIQQCVILMRWLSRRLTGGHESFEERYAQFGTTWQTEQHGRLGCGV